MKKLTLFLMVALLSSATAFAQISTGEPNSSVVPRTGNRPQAGDFGLYLGTSVTQIMDLVQMNQDKDFENNIFWALPMINLKYYATDSWEVRMGFQFASQGNTLTYELEKGDVRDYTRTRDINYTRFLPGAAYHFNTKNILDVYVGAQMPIGFNINSTRENVGKGDYKTLVKDNKFVIGGGVFMGMQVFIADLPFAIGLELGYSGTASFSAGKVSQVETDGEKQKSVTFGEEGTVNNVKKSAYMEGRWGADAALTFTYYFKK